MEKYSETISDLTRDIPNKKEWIKTINEEGDFKEWQYKGYTLRIVRPGDYGKKRDRRTLPLRFHLCGYVKVNKRSPLFGKIFTAELIDWGGFINKDTKVGSRGMIPLLGYALGGYKHQLRIPMDVLFDIHGGITYASHLEPATWELLEEKKKNTAPLKTEATKSRKKQIREWWIGFDCGHAGDIGSPWDLKFKETPGSNLRYYSMRLVKKETERLADQIQQYEKAYQQRWWRWIPVLWNFIVKTTVEIIKEARPGDLLKAGRKYFVKDSNIKKK